MLRWTPLAALLICVSAIARGQSLVEITAALGLGQAGGSPASHQLTAGLVAADIDGDGHLDLLSIGGGILQHRRGRAGGFAPPTDVSGLDRQRTYEGLTIADFDGDGDLDLVVLGRGRSHLFLLEDGRFTDVSATHLPPLGGTAMTALPVDLDGDGDLDLVISHYVDIASFPFHRCASSAVLSNEGGARFVDRTRASGLHAAAGCTFVTVAHDVDGDGRLELLEVNDFAQTVAGHSLWVERGRDAAGWPRYEDLAAPLGFKAPAYGMGLAIADADGDGDDEYVLSNIGQVVAMRFDRREGRFVPFDSPPVRFSSEDQLATWTATFRDLDGDGGVDLLMAGSTLGAAAMVLNRDPPESPVVSWRDGAWSAWSAGRSFGPARDAVSVDVDGDGIPELLAIDRAGAVRAWRRPPPAAAPFLLHLRPTLTASAWGARATLRCADGPRGFSATGGQHYGQSAQVVLELSAPLACTGAEAEVEVLWPSGWRDSVVASRGDTTVVTEPAWQRLEPNALVVAAADLAHLGLTPEDVAADAGGLRLLAPEVTEAGDLRLPFEAIAQDTVPLHAPDPWIGLRLQGAPPRSIHRIPGITANGERRPPLWLGGAPLVAGVPVNGWVGADVTVTREGAGGAEPLATVPFMGGRAFVLTPDASDETLRVGRARYEIAPAPDHDVSTAQLIASDHVFTQALATSRTTRARLRLKDAAGRGADIAPARIELVWRGAGESLGNPAPSGGGWYIWELARTSLTAGGELVATVDGIEVPGRIRPVRLSSASALGGLVSLSASRCALSEPWLDVVDGDHGTLLATFRDADGHELPLLGLTPAWTQGGGIAPIVDAGMSSSGFLQTPVVTAFSALSGDSPVVRVGNMAASLPCTSERRAAPLQAFDPSRTPVRPVSAEPLRVDALAEFVVVPTSPAGRAIGPGMSLLLQACGAPDSPTADTAIPPIYAGGGRYTFSLVPRGEGRLCVGVGLDGSDVVPARTHVFVHAAAVEPDPDPEPGPEPTPEEASETFIDPEPSPDPEIGPDALHVEDAGQAELPTVDADTQTDDGAAETSADATDGTELSQDASPPEVREDGGCRGGHAPALIGFLVTALCAWRQRERDASMRV